MKDVWNVFDGLTDAEAEELIRNQREYEEELQAARDWERDKARGFTW